MITGTLNKNDADKNYYSWKKNPGSISLTDEEKAIREDLLLIFQETLDETGIEEESRKIQSYQIDLYFGLKLYQLLNNKYNVNIRTASDNGFWRYLSVNIIPDLVHKRWGDNDARFWKNNNRVWLKTLWWYIYLSWQGDMESTKQVLTGNTTDHVVQLVERAGVSGYRVDFTRSLMRIYDRKKSSLPQDMFRKVLKLNTAMVKTIEPALYAEGEEAYVRDLFSYFERNQREI